MPRKLFVAAADRRDPTPELLASIAGRMRKAGVQPEPAFMCQMVARAWAAGDDVWLYLSADKLYLIRRRLMEFGFDISEPVDAEPLPVKHLRIKAPKSRSKSHEVRA